MTLRFEYDHDENCLILRAYKVDVRVIFDDAGDVWFIDIGTGHDFIPSDDRLHGLAVQINNEWHTLHQIMTDAEKQYPGILEETLQEIEEDNRMMRALSSPRTTGRI